MFDSGYNFNLVYKKVNPEPHILCKWIYNFKTLIRRYIIVVELYAGDIYIIKYYAACHSNSEHKFSFVFNDERPSYIIRTCIDVMLEFYKENPSASFGFIGASSINKIKKGKLTDNKTANTQRYRIYKTLMFNFFGKKTFAHSTDKKYSAYLMINRRNKGIWKFKKDAQDAFSKLYVDLNFNPPPPVHEMSIG